MNTKTINKTPGEKDSPQIAENSPAHITESHIINPTTPTATTRTAARPAIPPTANGAPAQTPSSSALAANQTSDKTPLAKKVNLELEVVEKENAKLESMRGRFPREGSPARAPAAGKVRPGMEGARSSVKNAGRSKFWNPAAGPRAGGRSRAPVGDKSGKLSRVQSDWDAEKITEKIKIQPPTRPPPDDRTNETPVEPPPKTAAPPKKTLSPPISKSRIPPSFANNNWKRKKIDHNPIKPKSTSPTSPTTAHPHPQHAAYPHPVAHPHPAAQRPHPPPKSYPMPLPPPSPSQPYAKQPPHAQTRFKDTAFFPRAQPFSPVPPPSLFAPNLNPALFRGEGEISYENASIYPPQPHVAMQRDRYSAEMYHTRNVRKLAGFAPFAHPDQSNVAPQYQAHSAFAPSTSSILGPRPPHADPASSRYEINVNKNHNAKTTPFVKASPLLVTSKISRTQLDRGFSLDRTPAETALPGAGPERVPVQREWSNQGAASAADSVAAAAFVASAADVGRAFADEKVKKAEGILEMHRKPPAESPGVAEGESGGVKVETGVVAEASGVEIDFSIVLEKSTIKLNVNASPYTPNKAKTTPPQTPNPDIEKAEAAQKARVEEKAKYMPQLLRLTVEKEKKETPAEKIKILQEKIAQIESESKDHTETNLLVYASLVRSLKNQIEDLRSPPKSPFFSEKPEQKGAFRNNAPSYSPGAQNPAPFYPQKAMPTQHYSQRPMTTPVYPQNPAESARWLPLGDARRPHLETMAVLPKPLAVAAGENPAAEAQAVETKPWAAGETVSEEKPAVTFEPKSIVAATRPMPAVSASAGEKAAPVAAERKAAPVAAERKEVPKPVQILQRGAENDVAIKRLIEKSLSKVVAVSAAVKREVVVAKEEPKSPEPLPKKAGTYSINELLEIRQKCDGKNIIKNKEKNIDPKIDSILFSANAGKFDVAKALESLLKSCSSMPSMNKRPNGPNKFNTMHRRGFDQLRHNGGGKRNFNMNFGNSAQYKTMAVPKRRPESSIKRPVLVENKTKYEQLRSDFKGFLNKITKENLNTISEKIIQILQKSDQNDAKIYEILIESIFKKAIVEQRYSKTYAELIDFLDTRLKNHTVSYDGGENSHLLEINKLIVLNIIAKYKEMNGIETNKEMSLIKKNQIMEKALGNIKFAGELYLLKRIPAMVLIKNIMNILNKNPPSEKDFDVVCKLLVTIGEKLDNISDTKTFVSVKNIYKKIEELVEAMESCRTKFLLKDILQLRKSNWTSIEMTNEPKKKSVSAVTNRFSNLIARKDKDTKNKVLPVVVVDDKTWDDDKSPRENFKKYFKDRKEKIDVKDFLLFSKTFGRRVKNDAAVFSGLLLAAVEFCYLTKTTAESTDALMAVVAEKKLFLAADIEKGLKTVTSELEEMTMDLPLAPVFFSRAFAQLAKGGAVGPGLLAEKPFEGDLQGEGAIKRPVFLELFALFGRDSAEGKTLAKKLSGAKLDTYCSNEEITKKLQEQIKAGFD